MARILAEEKDFPKARDHYSKAVAISKSATDRSLEQLLNIPRKTRQTVHAPEEVLDDSNAAAPVWEEDEELDQFGESFDGGFSEFEEDSFSPSDISIPFAKAEEETDLEHFDADAFERPDGSFSDVAGLDEVKEELKMKLIYPFEYADWFRAYGKKAGGGVLLFGPTGCGKSLIARAVAGETDAAFFNVRLHEILEEYAGCSEKNLHCVFQQARELAPSVIFIDELDALANRNHFKHNGARSAVNELLMELDGYDEGGNEGVLIIGATSAFSDIDPAFLRPGRFCRKIFVAPPNELAREQILKLHARNRPVGAIDYKHLAKAMADFSGADISQVFELAIDDALRLAMSAGEIVPLTTELLEAASQRIEPSVSGWKGEQK
jgi:transitional endoplasmic reticulum ATPase